VNGPDVVGSGPADGVQTPDDAPVPQRRPAAAPLLRIRGLTVAYRARRTGEIRPRTLRAVDRVDLDVHDGETVGLVGESGCGKSTLARAIVGLEPAHAGRIELAGRDVASCRGEELRAARRDVALLFQDPHTSLSPRMSVEELVAEPLRIHASYGAGGAGRRRVVESLDLVGLSAADLPRYARELSGGQRQRVGLARALVLSPRLLVLDEPVSALDVSIQAQIVALLHDLQRTSGVAMLFISHDLAVVRAVCDRVAVMYLGRVVETGTRSQIYGEASHPYTQALLSAVPTPDPGRRADRIVLTGELPHPLDPPSGCGFRTRCWKAEARCVRDVPELGTGTTTHPVACHLAGPLRDGT
jgi:oligopeptide/dipeptide ABC transporter ATP-binding protein